MTAGVFDGLWPFGQRFVAFDADAPEGREFAGFIEPISAALGVNETRVRAGVLPEESFRLIASPSESFPRGTATVLVSGDVRYEVKSVKEIYAGERICYRECVVMKTGKAGDDA